MDVLRAKLNQFHPISDEIWATITSASRELPLAKGDFLLRAGQLLQERPKVIRRIPQYMIAAYVGVTPAGLSPIKRRVGKI